MEQMTEVLKAKQEMMETQIGSLASQMDTNQAKKMDANQAEMKVNQAKMDADLREMGEEIMARLEAMLQNNQEKTDANQKEIRVGQELLKEEMLAKMESNQERMDAMLDSLHERMIARMGSHIEKMEACLGKTEAMNLEAKPEKIQSEAENEEVPKEEVTVETFGALERYGDRHLIVQSRGQLKKRTQANSESWKKLAAARRRLTCSAIPAQRKGHSHQRPGKDNVVQGTQKGQMLGKRRLVKLEYNNGIRNRDLQECLCLGSERTSGRIFGKTTGLEIVKLTVGSSGNIKKMSV
jgi:hypothetical protein